jgi:hypothetical protein
MNAPDYRQSGARYLPTACPEVFGGNLTNQRQLGAPGQAAHPHATEMRLKPLPKRPGPNGLTHIGMYDIYTEGPDSFDLSQSVGKRSSPIGLMI